MLVHSFDLAHGRVIEVFESHFSMVPLSQITLEGTRLRPVASLAGGRGEDRRR
ncbi:MAG: hypothetical protein AAGD33_13175 [Actinomycetota bacterium]